MVELQLTKNQIRARKAWETRKTRERGKTKTKTYCSIHKNEFRERVIEIFKSLDEGSLILALESPEFLFVDRLKEYNFIVFENDSEQFKKMVECNRENVKSIYHADVSAARMLSERFNAMFLDFCNTFDNNVERIELLLSKIERCGILAFTFCLRGNKKEMEDYKFDLIKKLGSLLPDFQLEYAISYRDGAPMVGIILKENNQHRFQRTRDNERICEIKLEVYQEATRCIESMEGEPYLIEHNIFYDGRSTKIRNDELFTELWNKLSTETKYKIAALKERERYVNWYQKDEPMPDEEYFAWHIMGKLAWGTFLS